MRGRTVFLAFVALATSPNFGNAFVAPRNLNSIAFDTSLNVGGSYLDSLSSIQPASSAAPAVETAAPAAPAAAGGAAVGDAIAAMDASQQGSVAAIAGAIPDLVERPEFSWSPADGVAIAGCPATLDARDAAGPANVAWLSSLCIAGKESSLTIFNGPMTDVPHLLSRCIVNDDNSLTFDLDFRPRAYGAYELKDEAGNYPGPEELGRKAFEYSGNRMEYFNKFVNEEVVAFLESTMASLEGCVEANPSPTEEELLTQGPYKISVTMPATEGNVATVTAAREQAASYWLSWAVDDSHTHRPGAPINTQHVYDSKYKINAYGALLPLYSAVYGPEDGAALTAAEMGPLDEAYVGGGS